MQGSCASQMTAAKVMDIKSRLPGCDGQAADAASAYTQVGLDDAPRLFKFPKSECPDVWIRLPRHKTAEIPETLKILRYFSNGIYIDIPLAGLFWERQFEDC